MALESLIDTIGRAYDKIRHRDALVAVWEADRWFDTSHQREAAARIRDFLDAPGLSHVEFVKYACDGYTRYQDWITHLAWDCGAAQICFADGGKPLTDREKTPSAVVCWSAPLGRRSSPVAGEVIDGDTGLLTPDRVNGRFVLTAQPPLEMKRRLLDLKPLAVVSDHLGPGRGYDDETVKWWNAWSDGPDGWYFHANDRPMTGFSLSPAAGRLLRERLAQEPNLKLAAFCESVLYDGEGQNVTAVLPGTDPGREVWIFGHACEIGAHDNASGVAIMIESLLLLNSLIRSGRLPRPRFSIRMITTEECIGMVAFATMRDYLRQRALAGLNIDGAGDFTTPEHPFVFHFGGLSNPSFGWAVGGILVRELQRRAGGEWHITTKRFVPTADDMVGDPNCGIPVAWLGKGKMSLGYHSSADTPAVCSEDSLRFNTLLTATWAYIMASLDADTVAHLLVPAAEWCDRDLVQAGETDAAKLSRWAGSRMFTDLARWDIAPGIYQPFAVRYAPTNSSPLADLPTTGRIYRRRVWGTCTFETLPPEKRKGLSRWSNFTASGLYWTNGTRPLSAVERLARAETDASTDKTLRPAFEAAVEAGTMELTTDT
ncbi:MAG: M28 family peptidase [Kiritimatiellae bacterium]|nr:M28 family peptidase [Kiritimatiellia bacterium]